MTTISINGSSAAKSLCSKMNIYPTALDVSNNLSLVKYNFPFFQIPLKYKLVQAFKEMFQYPAV